jgi:hypothetical protein
MTDFVHISILLEKVQQDSEIWNLGEHSSVIVEWEENIELRYYLVPGICGDLLIGMRI